MKTTFNPKLINLYGIRFPQEWIFLHLICIGGTGSGKTRGVLRPLISQLAAADLHSPELRPAMVIFDVKGDMKPIVEDALKS